MTTSAEDPLDAPTAALAAAVLEIARHVSEDLAGTRLFALARSAELLATAPGLAAVLLGEDARTAAPDELHLTPVEWDLPPEAGTGAPSTMWDDPLSVLEYVQWPDAPLAAGAGVACRLAASSWEVREGVGAQEMPLGEELLVVVAALADGTTWSAVQRGDEGGYVLGAALVPGLAAALQQTLEPAP
jgi:hypothetical protein